MKIVILLTLLALVGSSLAASLAAALTARAGPPLRPAAISLNAANDDKKYDHIHAEVRPERPETAVVDSAPHQPLERPQQPDNSIDKQPQQHQLELNVLQQPSPHQVQLEVVAEHHKQPEHHHYVELEINQERPVSRPHHVELEIKQAEHKPQHVDVNIVADQHKQPAQHQLEFDIVSQPRPYHIAVELNQQQAAAKPHHVEVQLLQQPQPYQDFSLQQYVQL